MNSRCCSAATPPLVRGTIHGRASSRPAYQYQRSCIPGRKGLRCGAATVGVGWLATGGNEDEASSVVEEPFAAARCRWAATLCCSVTLDGLIRTQLLARLVAGREEAWVEQVGEVTVALRNEAMVGWGGSPGAAFNFALSAIRGAEALLDIISRDTALRLLALPGVAAHLGRCYARPAVRFLLRECGLSSAQLLGAVATQPSVLGLDVDDALRPMAHYLRTTYTDDKSPVTVARLLASHPEVLMCSLDDGCVVNILGGSSSGSPRSSGEAASPHSAATAVDFEALVSRRDPFAFAYGLDMAWMRDGVWWRALPEQLQKAGLSSGQAAAVRDAVSRQVPALNDVVGLSAVSLAHGLRGAGCSAEAVAELMTSCPRVVQCAKPPPQGSRAVLAALTGLGGLDGAGLVSVLSAAPEVLGLHAESQLRPLLRELAAGLRVGRPYAVAEALLEQPQLLTLRSTEELRKRLLETGIRREIQLHALKSLTHESFSERTVRWLSTAQQAAGRLTEAGFPPSEAAALAELMAKLQLEAQVFYTGRCPSLGDMVSTVEAMCGLSLSTDLIYSTFSRHPRLFRHAEEEGIQAVLAHLMERLHLKDDTLEALLQAAPEVLALCPSQQLLPALDAVAEGGWTAREVCVALHRCPNLLALPPQKALIALKYLHSTMDEEGSDRKEGEGEGGGGK
eukprot:CAMPEP_0177762998 /NCGR_PEP_ID=MMETSP0491_2-20121128/6638_1 /TAXON_ID=63592 /ORGANISM="Tetraselmis chuii, Strain PLY429" /LENGTH=679 /DNA_ID=CAMNT_0019279079 /DNA_START=481 /DNA_END=2520 /DNA_ORIENTATION=+